MDCKNSKQCGTDPTADKSKIDHFQAAVNNEIAFCDAEITKRKNEIESYKAVQKRLEDLPKKLSHRVNVPLSRVGFMKGRIVHTNKVMVSLGDNYFVDRSCFQASEIIDRRIACIQKLIDDFQNQKARAERRKEMSNTLFNTNGEQVEICEPLDEKAYEDERARRRVRKTVNVVEEEAVSSEIVHEDEASTISASLKEEENANEERMKEEDVSLEATASSAPKGIDDKEFKKILARLEELQRQEDEAGELDESNSSLDSDDYPDGYTQQTRLEADEEEPYGTFSASIAPSDAKVSEVKEEHVPQADLSSDLANHGSQKGHTETEGTSDRLEVMSLTTDQTANTEQAGKKVAEVVESVATVSQESPIVDDNAFVDAETGNEEVASVATDSPLKRRMVRFKAENEMFSAVTSPESPTEVREEEIEPKRIINEEPRFACPLPRSILRNSAEKSPVDVEALAAVAESEKPRPIVPISEKAFTGKIVEHMPTDTNEVVVMVPAKDSSPRRMSRFKMSRAHLD